MYARMMQFSFFIAQLNAVLLILGGHDIPISQAPYQVNYGDICGGVLVHKKWALTTAHCGITHNFIRIGSKHRLRGPKVRIISHLVHPKFGVQHTFDYDIQLLELKRKLFFGKSVTSIEFCYGNCGDEFLISGWGYAFERGDYKDILQQTRITLVEFTRCQTVNQSWYNHSLTSRMFCAGGKEKDSCQGDSGGGAVAQGKLAGISSFGFGCGRVPGVYINTSHPNIRTWVRKYTGI